MQNEYFSDSPSQSGASEISPTHNEQTIDTGFTITPKDVDVLQQYLDEFQEADTTLRTRIIEKAMGELYQLRPVSMHFDKKEASKVCRMSMNRCICTLLYDLENTEMVLQSLHTPSTSVHQVYSEMVCQKRILSLKP